MKTTSNMKRTLNMMTTSNRKTFLNMKTILNMRTTSIRANQVQSTKPNLPKKVCQTERTYQTKKSKSTKAKHQKGKAKVETRLKA